MSYSSLFSIYVNPTSSIFLTTHIDASKENSIAQETASLHRKYHLKIIYINPQMKTVMNTVTITDRIF